MEMEVSHNAFCSVILGSGCFLYKSAFLYCQFHQFLISILALSPTLSGRSKHCKKMVFWCKKVSELHGQFKVRSTPRDGEVHVRHSWLYFYLMLDGL